MPNSIAAHLLCQHRRNNFSECGTCMSTVMRRGDDRSDTEHCLTKSSLHVTKQPFGSADRLRPRSRGHESICLSAMGRATKSFASPSATERCSFLKLVTESEKTSLEANFGERMEISHFSCRCSHGSVFPHQGESRSRAFYEKSSIFEGFLFWESNDLSLVFTSFSDRTLPKGLSSCLH